uniref:Uncharacterized protein n=1 Tax=Callorhinchus milii TaxID=7868 RepID=A0A4W3HJD4_CALMI
MANCGSLLCANWLPRLSVERWLRKNADPNLVLPEGLAAVHLASVKDTEGGLKCLKLILQHQGDPNLGTVEDLTPLHIAASWGCLKSLKLLLRYGADPSLQDQVGVPAQALGSFEVERNTHTDDRGTLPDTSTGTGTARCDSPEDRASLSGLSAAAAEDRTPGPLRPDPRAAANGRLSEPVDASLLLFDDEGDGAANGRDPPPSGDGDSDSSSELYASAVEGLNVSPDPGPAAGREGTPGRGGGGSGLAVLLRKATSDPKRRESEFEPSPPSPVSSSASAVTPRSGRRDSSLFDRPVPAPARVRRVLTKMTRFAAEFSAELCRSLETFVIPDCRQDELILSQQFDQPDQIRRWRGGLVKSSFNYLLLDPRVTMNLPARSHALSDDDCFRIFVNAIFYVGKGKRSRPYSHLNEAQKHFNNVRAQLQRIMDIWADGLGVISLHCFQNVIAVEDSMGQSCIVHFYLTNQKRGDYYGTVATWTMKRRRQLGVHLIRQASLIFLAEGERQLRPADI